MSSRRSVTALAGVVVTLLTLTACIPAREQVSPDASRTGETTQAQVEPQDSRVYQQTIEWVRCAQLECATVQVPLDWSHPNGQTITLALNRHAALDPDQRLGSLLINPGGPGGSGLELNEYFVMMAGERLLDSYDVIGFDPRGVGDSTPIRCGNGPELDAYFMEDAPLTTEDELEDARQRTLDFAQACRENSGPVVEFMDTVSAARDMDVIRAVVGDEQLNYLGYSYGTQLGATYAQLYPEQVGRLVLDGAVDVLLTSSELSEGQASGFENALTNFLRWCLEEPDCALSSDIDEAREQIRDMGITARDEGYPTGTRWDINGNLMIYGIVVTLYDQASWEFLKIAVNEVIEEGRASTFYALGNFYLDRDGNTGEYQGNSTLAFTAIGCLDETDTEPWTLEELREFADKSEETSPTFGWWFATGLGCEGWPWQAAQTLTDLDAAAGAAPMLVIGTTNDPATPFAWSESLAEQLDATLLTWDGEGHTAYGRSNQCVIDAVDAYLVDGTLPDSGKRC